ncbi:SDR family oxidoreductase [Amylibacter sp.]|nr:SDR family oxidoreductase [Amylibacter sp.]MDC1253047.1 SDR family oxidoreductase [Amylibacter sp.]
MDFMNKKAIVFGGTSGIGLASVKMLEKAGAEVVAIGRSYEKKSELPNGVKFVACDVRDEVGVKTLLEKLAPFDILISSATGGKRAIGPFLEMDMDGFKGSFDKLWGYANVVRHGSKHLTDGGSITLVSGSPGRNCKFGQIALSSVGGAVEAMARAVAKEVSPRIRINIVSPGTINTPMVTLKGPDREKLYENMTKDNLIPRAGTADEVAEGIMFVVKNKFVTGTTVDVDGGWLIS